MNKIISDSENYKLLRIFDEFTQSKNISILDRSSDNSFLSSLAETLDKLRTTQTLLHGLRIQSLFPYIVASLGKCLHISEEDLGDYYSKEPEIERPDFRIVLESRENIFVEVKNYYQTNPRSSFKIKPKYLQSLLTYADLHSAKLKFAIYWAKWGNWTLIDPRKIAIGDKGCQFDFGEACQCNEMYILGDCLLGTIPPLSIKFETETIENLNNSFTVQIKNAYLKANNSRIVDRVESKIASFLLFNCRWDRVEESAEIENGRMTSFELQLFSNEESTDANQDFQMLGYLSEMLTRQYNLMTTDNGKVKAISSVKQPINVEEMIPNGFKGEILKLWQFKIMPKE